ncbi:hypothetical protein JTE90_027568 [Oedothorax gibbosus]|uniref:Uncharacterized protein n=1 Tax=Oedothorax gibbosus TaxID=931172 RepID=A0AAV6VMS7_9ARAC|nr:hypothetical protein JTE90_027568 [Oedothorax gibbosus]
MFHSMIGQRYSFSEGWWGAVVFFHGGGAVGMVTPSDRLLRDIRRCISTDWGYLEYQLINDKDVILLRNSLRRISSVRPYLAP